MKCDDDNFTENIFHELKKKVIPEIRLGFPSKEEMDSIFIQRMERKEQTERERLRILKEKYLKGKIRNEN